MAGLTAFAKRPLAFFEDPEAERVRVERLRRDDPITLQDAVNTSVALVEAVKERDLEEMRRVVADAVEGEFLQVFVLQALVIALKGASLDIVREMVSWGVPLGHEELSQSLHLVCEITTRDNFSDAWRIVQILVEGNGEETIDVNTPRGFDGWTPLCIACADACLPLAFKLLELEADPNVITRSNDTPMSIVRKAQANDSEEQHEARGIICNMLRSYGGQERWQDALTKSRKPKRRPKPEASVTVTCEDGSQVTSQSLSATHSRFSA
mmetsp:Transcript_37255/g.79124  ORF Transcript_37255/g.79124 Transcript_37255/m.79124 type:complete len:267 (-) Transcript_37255:53-853(-)